MEQASMSYAVAAIGIGTAVAGVTGAVISSNASKDAAAQQLTAQEQALQTQERLGRESLAFQREYGQKAIDAQTAQYNQSRADLQPFVQSQLAALQQAQGLTDANNPLYQQQRAQMTQNIQRQLAAQGLLRSKNQVDLLGNLELGLEEQRFNRINALAGTGAAQQSSALAQSYGQGLASSYGNLGQQIGSTIGNIGQGVAQGQINIGNILGQNSLQQGQIFGGLTQQIGNTVQGTYGNYVAQQNQAQQMAMFQKLLAGQAAAGAGGAGFGATAPLN